VTNVRLRESATVIRHASRRVDLLILALLLVAGCARRDELNAPARGKVAAEIADQGPRLVGQPPTVQIDLPPRMTAALAADVKSFTTLTPFDFAAEIVPGTSGWSYPYDSLQAPFAVIADFDGDGRDDVALLQHNARGGRAAVVLDTAPAPRVLVLRSWVWNVLENSRSDPGPERFYLTRFPAGRFRVPDFGGSGDTSQVADLAHEGVELAYFGKSATTYYWSDGAFRSVTTSD
jgi:hypothetical protein